MTEATATNAGAPSSDLEQLKTVFNACLTKLKGVTAPQTELETICEAIRDAVRTDRMATDSEFGDWIKSEVAISLMQKLAKCASFDQTYVTTCADTMEAFMDLFAHELKAKRFCEQFTCAMTWCFQPETTLHKRNFQMSDDDLKRLSTSRQTWRAALKAGDQIDVAIAGDDKEKTKGWAQAHIERVDGEILSVVVPTLPVDFDRDIERWSTEIAQFETHTKEDYAWRRENLVAPNLVDVLVDCHDGFRWEESTIFNVTESNQGGRSVILANVGFRVYREVGKKLRTDERGVFDGWSAKYDELIPVYSPRFQAHMSRVDQGVIQEDSVDEELDDLMVPEPGHTRVFGVPRISSCISSKFVSFMNRFGHNGGFDAILEVLSTGELDDTLTLTTMGYLITMISMPAKLFHKDWLAEYAIRFTTAMRKQLLESPDKILKDVTANDVSQIQISINSVNARVLDRDEAKQEQEKLKLEICKKCLSSELLERRILGIKELNTIIRSTQTAYGPSKAFSLEWLINWMSGHGVFDILWDTKKTHLQLVQRSNEIFKILPKENLLTMELLEQFWSLSKSDYKSEVFKIIGEAAFHLDQNHIDYLFDEITETPASKLGMEEFDALSSLGRFSRSLDFQSKTSSFFLRIINDSDEHKIELIENCINKFADMIKLQSMEKKKVHFDMLVTQLQNRRSSALPVIQLFKKIIRDQKETQKYAGGSGGYQGTQSTTKTVVNGVTVIKHSEGGQGGQGADEEADPVNISATLTSVLNNLVENQGFVEALLDNMRTYREAIDAKAAADPGALKEQDRTKLFLLNPKYSHQDEVNERLSFLQEFAMNSDFKISKAQLEVIYGLLTQSPISSDFTEFLTWCKTACEAQTVTTTVLDLDEVGEFFSELISSKRLNLKALPIVGLDFLQMFFTRQNLIQGKLFKIAAPVKQKPNNTWSTNYYGASTKNDEDDDKPSEDDATFKVRVDPSELTDIKMAWETALQCEIPEVNNKAVAFLVNCYLSVDEVLEDRRNEIMQSLNNRCFELIAESQENPARIKRLVRILEGVIQISEKKGTGDVQPHNAILKGEMLDRIIIRYMVKNKNWGARMQVDRTIVVKLFSSATVWEFKKEVSQMLGLAPKYMKITLPSKELLRDSQHGMTLQELGMKNGDILNAEKLSVVEEITEVPLVDYTKKQLVPRAIEIFSEWYDMYKDLETGLMNDKSVAAFIQGATKSTCNKDDNRVEGIINKYDTDKDGQLTLDDFLRFYYDAATGASSKAVKDNLKCHNVRLDLKKMSDVVDEVSYSANEMPRHTLSANQEQFQTLFSLLDRNDESSEQVWNLVRMLATNQQMYDEVLSLSTAQSASGMNWASVFEDSSLYKQIYKQEIIVAVMEASKSSGELKRVMYVEDQQIAATSYQTSTTKNAAEEEKENPMEESTQDTTATDADDTESARIENLKANWTKQFLEQQGFQFILSNFIAKQVSSADAVTFSEQASLKDVAFLTTLLRVFLQAGFNAKESNIGGALRLVRKSSRIDEENDDSKKNEGSLTTLMNGPVGLEIMDSVNFDQLFDKVLQLLATMLSKKSQIFEDKVIIENALSIMIGSLLYKNELYAKFTAFKTTTSSVNTAESLVLAGLLCSEEKVRIDFERSLSVLAIYLNRNENNALYFILGVLGRNFASISNKPSRQFFEVFNKLIDQKALRDDLMGEAADNSNSIYNPEDLLNQIIDKIKAQQKLQKATEADAEGDEEADEVKAMELANEQERLLVGLITLTGKIITKADKTVSDRIIQEKDLIGQIFKEFLFASYFQAQEENADNSSIVIKQQVGSRSTKKQAAVNNSKSREAAYALLHQLIQNSTKLMKTFIESQLSPLIQTIKKPKSWNYVPSTQSEGSQKYLGLRNLGCICYMISMIQQFFMVPAFRYNLMCIDDGKAEDMQEYKGEQIDDNMMHQLQKLIAHLELSDRSEFNPKDFCFSFKEFDGTPINVMEQKDSQEFLNVIFDRLENSLKETTRKHLIQGIFGGKQCSQMVCTECGKVKNRVEDYLNLSLPIKGVKSIEESLQKQIEGEIINDYQCSGCNRKVDLQKRTMIASTPNILIVHLQRICFNFDTFQNDKVNTFCSFPNVLDLKPYSFHEVMGKENRLKEQQPEEEELSLLEIQQQQQRENEMTEEELEAKKEAEDDAREPERDDCYEYKLVGVNVHSGTANAGHYWSYINTNRGIDEKDNDPNWIKTESDPWMEYNDSRVSDWDFKELRQRTFGNEAKSGGATTGGYFSAMGDSYGTSAYMLFYERRAKRDLKIIVQESQVEEQKAKGSVDISYDEEKKEHYKMSPYRSAADGELANDIYKKVAEDNMKFSFESDIYSTEFFDFILQILQSVADQAVDADTKAKGLKIGAKVGFEILARMMTNPGIDKVAQVMIDILKSRPEITSPFLASMCDFTSSETLWEVLLEAPDKNAQKQLSRVIIYALCQLKAEERESALAMEQETVTNSFTDSEGNARSSQESRPKAICIRFITMMTELLAERAPNNWRKFEAFLEIFYSFMVYSAEEVASDKNELEPESESCKLGIEIYFKYNMIRYLGDFILQESSPYQAEGQTRVPMGGNYGNPNFSALLKTIILMISDREMMAKYPLDELNQAVVSHKDILQKMIEPAEESGSDFTGVLLGMARDNESVSKKMAKSYLKGVSKSGLESLVTALKQIRQFLKIDDSLKEQRFEWIFGIPQILSKPNFRTRSQQYGAELIELISDEYWQFKSGCVKGVSDAFLGQLYKAKGRMDSQCVVGLRNLVEMCVEDPAVARYVFRQPAPSLQFARYSDWFFPYAEALKAATLNQIKNTTTLLDYHKNRLESLEVILGLQEQLEAIYNPWIEEQKTKLAAISDTEHQGYAGHTLYPALSEVLPSYPPAYIVGPTIFDSSRILMTEETELATITIEEISCEYMYSNPEGRFNLSMPEKMWRNPVNYQQMGYKSWKLIQLRADPEASSSGEPAMDQIIHKNWETDKSRNPTILRVMAKSKAARMIRVGIKLRVADNEKKNVNFPITEIKENLFANDSKQAFVFLKIDPSKEEWGDIEMEVSAAHGKTAPIATSYNSGGYYGGVSSYTGTSVSTGTGGTYKPIGYDPSDTMMNCVNCPNEVFVGEEYCAKCGKSTTEPEF